MQSKKTYKVYKGNSIQINVNTEEGGSIYIIEILGKKEWKRIGFVYIDKKQAYMDFLDIKKRYPKEKYRFVEIYFEPKKIIRE